MENKDKTSRNGAIIGTAAYVGILVLLFFLVSLKIPEKASSPPGGIDVSMPMLTEIETSSGGSDQDYGTSKDGAGSQNQENGGTKNPSSNNLTNPNSNHSTNGSNVNSNNNNWNDVWNTSNNSNGQGNTHGDGDQGNPNGTIGGHGNGPCKGCTGSGYSFGNGTALYLAKPSISNGDEGKAVVKVKIDKTGAVVGVEIKQKGTYGNIGDDSWNKIKQAAYDTKFPADETAGNQLRTGYLSYDLHPN